MAESHDIWTFSDGQNRIMRYYNRKFQTNSNKQIIMQAEILKSLLPEPLLMANLVQTVSTGIDNIIHWPLAQTGLLTLYCSSGEHGRCIQIKSESAFGGGVIGDESEIFEDLCETGSGDLFSRVGIDLETYGNAFLEIVRDKKKIF